MQTYETTIDIYSDSLVTVPAIVKERKPGFDIFGVTEDLQKRAAKHVLEHFGGVKDLNDSCWVNSLVASTDDGEIEIETRVEMLLDRNEMYPSLEGGETYNLACNAVLYTPDADIEYPLVEVIVAGVFEPGYDEVEYTFEELVDGMIAKLVEALVEEIK